MKILKFGTLSENLDGEFIFENFDFDMENKTMLLPVNIEALMCIKERIEKEIYDGLLDFAKAKNIYSVDFCEDKILEATMEPKVH